MPNSNLPLCVFFIFSLSVMFRCTDKKDEIVTSEGSDAEERQIEQLRAIVDYQFKFLTEVQGYTPPGRDSIMVILEKLHVDVQEDGEILPFDYLQFIPSDVQLDSMILRDRSNKGVLGFWISLYNKGERLIKDYGRDKLNGVEAIHFELEFLMSFISNSIGWFRFDTIHPKFNAIAGVPDSVVFSMEAYNSFDEVIMCFGPWDSIENEAYWEANKFTLNHPYYIPLSHESGKHVLQGAVQLQSVQNGRKFQLEYEYEVD